MARITDHSKLQSVKNSLIQIIIRDGTVNASINKVANQAGVSVGYLYRHYQSKEFLINELYQEEFNNLNHILLDKILSCSTFREVVFEFYDQIITQAKEDEDKILFLLKMMTDYSIKIPVEMRADLVATIEKLRGKFSDQINENIESEHLCIQILGSVLMFFNLRKRGTLKQGKITTNEIKILTDMTVKALG